MERFEKLRPLKKATVILSLLMIVVCAFEVLRMLEYIKTAFVTILFNALCIAGGIAIFYGTIFEEKDSHNLYGYVALAVSSIIQFIFYCTKDVFVWYDYSYYYGSEEEFYLIGFLAGLLLVVAHLQMLILAYVNSNKKIAALNNIEVKIKPFFESRWFMPFTTAAVVEVIAILNVFWVAFDGEGWYNAKLYSSLRSEIILAVFVVMSIAWKYKNGVPKAEKKDNVVIGNGTLSFRAYCGLVKFILLSFLTFGIWPLVWVYRMTDELNVSGFEYRTPVNKLLLFMFVPFYSMYWFYQTALRVDSIARSKGIISDISMLSLAFSMCFPFGSMLLIQGKVNEIIIHDNKAN